MVKRYSAVKKTVTKSPIHPPKKLNGKTRPPLSPSPSKLATKAKTPSSSTPPHVTPIRKSRPLPSNNQFKDKRVVARSLSSSATQKNKAATLKAPPPLPPRTASIKKKLNFKDQNGKKGEPKTQVTKPVATRRGSMLCTSNTGTKLKRKGLQLEKSVDVERAETMEFHGEEEEPSHAAEPGNQVGMELYNEVPEKTLYVIEMEAGSRDLTKADKSPPSAEVEIPDTQPLAPSSTNDDSIYIETEVDYIIHEDNHLVDGQNLKSAEKTNQKSAAAPLEVYSNDPVKLTFRRGRVIDITVEDNAPRRLSFRREHVVKENIANAEVRKRNYDTKEYSTGTVVLRHQHQDMEDRKDSKGLFNNVIEETASKLVETRKSKVKALVGAFETVISLQDCKTAATS